MKRVQEPQSMCAETQMAYSSRFSNTEKRLRVWSYMDQRTNHVYMLPRLSDDIRLPGQHLASGMRFKPLVDLEELRPGGGWVV